MSTLREFSKLLILFFCLVIMVNPGNGTTLRREAADFGGDFSAASLSGAEAPGPSAGTMGNKAASAMDIGTGGMGPGDYSSSYKTPNYTQYTQQDFKGTNCYQFFFTKGLSFTHMFTALCCIFRYFYYNVKKST